MRLPILCLALLVTLILGGCKREVADENGGRTVVVYTSIDEQVARPILAEFEKRTGIKVVARTDTEATKSAGLVARLEAEKSNPQADVWWGNEVFRTINLADQGVLAAYESPAAAGIPAHYKDAEHRWSGIALRARVITRTTADSAPASVRDVTRIEQLADPAFKGKICLATPTAGTTSGHISALYTLWGPEKFEAFLQKLKSNNVKLLGGNSVVAEYIGQGQMWAGLTDNDDVDAMLREGGKLDMVLPDQREGEIGTLTIPCTVALIESAPNPEVGKQLVDYLLSPAVEQMLLDAKFARYSVFSAEEETGVKHMNVTYEAVARNLRPAVNLAMKVLAGRD